jgi:alpha-1,6-mannosyltransferase
LKLCDVTMFYSSIGGGVRRYLETKRRWLRRAMPSVSHVLIVPGDEPGMVEDELGRIYSVGGIPLPFSPGYRLPVGGRRMGRILREESPDLIEAGSPFTMRRALSGTVGDGTPVFDYYHAYFPPSYAAALGRPLTFLKAPLLHYGWRYLRAAYADSARILVASPVIRGVLAEHGLTNTELAPLGVDVRRFDIRSGKRDDVPTVLFVGRLTEEKGLSVALETYRLLRQRTRVRLLVAGDGLLRETVEGLAETDPDVGYLGYVPNGRMPEVYARARLLISAAPTETLGLYFLEALACGVPVAGLSGSGLMDVLPDDVARAVPHQLPRELARVSIELLESPPSPERCREVALGYAWPRRLSRIVGLEADIAGIRLPQEGSYDG